MTATALSVLLAFSFAVQGVAVDEAVETPSPPAAAEGTPARAEPLAPAAQDDTPVPDDAPAQRDEREPAEDHGNEAEEGNDDEDRSSARFGAAIGSAAACGAGDALIGALFGACGLCFLVSSQSSDDLGEGIGQACSLFLGCPASLAVGVVPPLAAAAGGCLGAAFDDASLWGAIGGALPGVLVGVGGLALIVTGLALGFETDGQGRDVMVPWPLSPSSPPTAPDSLAYTAGLGIALLAGPIAVVGAALGGMAPEEEEEVEEGDDDEGERSVANDDRELRFALGSPDTEGAMRW